MPCDKAVARPLFGRGAVHGLDGEVHRTRKRMFVDALMDPERLAPLFELVDELLVDALQQWRRQGGGIVHPTATEVYGRAVIRWAGVDVPPDVEARRAEDLAAIVDGSATPVMPYVTAWRRRVVCDRCAAALVRDTRSGRRSPQQGSVLAQVAAHRGPDGELLDAHTAGVELLNVLRPTVATAGDGFAHEVRRMYPFVPALAAVAMRDTEFEGGPVPAGRRVLLDVMATDHDPQEWPDPDTFDPGRFVGTDAECSAPFVPQGGRRPESGHRCPGELVANGLLALTCARLAEVDGRLVLGQDLGWSWGRVPGLPRWGVVIAVDVGPPAG